MRELAADCVRLAQAGLEARGHADAAGLDERQYLDILAHRINTGRVAADDLIAAFNGRWGQKVDPVFRERMV
jgi:glutamate--cysteine ligase